MEREQKEEIRNKEAIKKAKVGKAPWRNNSRNAKMPNEINEISKDILDAVIKTETTPKNLKNYY